MKTFQVHFKQDVSTQILTVEADKFYLDVQMDGGAIVASYFFTVSTDEEDDISVASFPYDNVLAITLASS